MWKSKKITFKLGLNKDTHNNTWHYEQNCLLSNYYNENIQGHKKNITQKRKWNNTHKHTHKAVKGKLYKGHLETCINMIQDATFTVLIHEQTRSGIITLAIVFVYIFITNLKVYCIYLETTVNLLETSVSKDLIIRFVLGCVFWFFALFFFFF